MQVIFLAAECEPWAKTGGLGDVVDALARALGRLPGVLDAPVEVFLPRYPFTAIPDGAAVEALPVAFTDGAHGAVEVTIRSFEAGGYRLRLVDHPPSFDRPGIYGDGPHEFADNAARFGLLCRAALETRVAEGRPVDVIGLHDWHTCPAALLRETVFAGDPLIAGAAVTLTIHNPAYHGWIPRDRCGELGIGDEAWRFGDGWGIDLLREGIRHADIVNTVSGTYAREIVTGDGGKGLDRELRAIGDRLMGIINGLDMELWDPASDPVLAAPYSVDDLIGKAACRYDLTDRLGWDGADPSPIVGVIGRLDPQKGFDLVTEALPRMLDLGVRLVTLGSGDAGLLDGMRAIAAERPDRVALLERFDREWARRIYAGADLFLMPSRFEPCGQGQMIAMRYGTPPVGRATGGLADTIVDVSAGPELGNGFLFTDATADALVGAMERAVGAYRAGKTRGPAVAAWDGLVRRGMTIDWSWEASSAPAYVGLYRRAMAHRREVSGEQSG